MPARLALAVVLLTALVARPFLGRLGAPGGRASGCALVGRGTFPRHWVGCQADGGPSRELRADERLAVGLPVDPNTAGARELAFIPGLSRRLAAEVVAERTRGGPFGTADDLLRVRGIGPRRLELARPWLEVGAAR